MNKNSFMLKLIRYLLTLFISIISLSLYSQIDSSILSKSKKNEVDYWDKLRISFYMDSNYNATYDFQFYFNSGLKKLSLNEYNQAIHDFRITLSILNNTKIQEEDTTIKKIPSPLLYIGICKSLLGELDSAIYYYKKCISINKSVIESYNELGIISLNKREIDSALIHFYKGFDKDENNITTIYNIGYSYYLKGDYKAAKKYLKRAIEINSHFNMPYILLGDISSKEGDLIQAKDYYSLAINANPLATSGYYCRGMCYLDQKRETLAYSDFLKVYELDTMNYQTLFLIGILDMFSNRFESGVTRLTKALSKLIDRSNQQQLDDFKDIEFRAILIALNKGDLSVDEKNLGYQFIKNVFKNELNKNKDLSLNFFSKNKESSFVTQIYLLSLAKSNYSFTIEFLDDFIDKDSSLTLAFFIKGYLLLGKRKIQESIDCFSKVINNSELYSNAFYYRGLAYYYSSKYILAINDFNKVISLYPSCAVAYNDRGNAYQDRSKDREAIKDYLKAIRINPYFTYPYNNISISYRNLNILDSAIYYSTIAIGLNPTDYNPYYNRSLAYKEIKEFNKAINDLNRTLELVPNWKFALTHRSDIFIETGDFANAIKDLSECIKMSPSDIEFYYKKRANAYFNIKDYDNAINDFQKLIDINSNVKYAIINVGKCYQEKKDIQIAIKYFDLALQKDSTLSIAYFQKGLCYEQEKDFENAIRLFFKAISFDPTYSLPYSSLARIYYSNGDFNKCILYSQKAVELDKAAFYAMYNIALANLRQNQIAVAKRLYQLFAKINVKKAGGIYQGAIDDLKDLINKGILVNESKEILKDVFNIQP